MILLNSRGQRTLVAAALVILDSVFSSIAGIWLNGSFFYFFNKVKEQLLTKQTENIIQQSH